MNTEILMLVVLIVLGCLNALPWLVLLVKRPDNELLNQLQESDEALAGLFNHLLMKVDAMEDMGGGLNDNPLLNIAQMFLKHQFGDENLYGRSINGQFDGTKEKGTQTTLDSDIFDGSG